MRKIFIAIAASLLVAVGTAVSLKQVHSKFLQTAQAELAEERRPEPAPYHEEEDDDERAEGEEEGEWAEDEEPEEDGDEEEEPQELAQR